MPKNKFTTQLADVINLLDLADAITFRDPALSYLANRPMPSPLLAGAVVLLCARFEEFLKDVVVYALERHSYSEPPLTLWDLPEKLQVHLISKNLNAAVQANRHGALRPSAQRINEALAAAGSVVNGVIDAEYAIETGGNPGPETVAGLLKIVGVEDPWRKIADYFHASYVPPSIPGNSNVAVTDPVERLRELVKLRNIVAHSGVSIPASSAEIRFDADFLNQISNSIYEVLREHVEEFSRSSGRVPAVWIP